MSTPKSKDQLDAERYRKYRAMVIAGLPNPVSTQEFDATLDSAIIPPHVLDNPSLWGECQPGQATH